MIIRTITGEAKTTTATLTAKTITADAVVVEAMFATKRETTEMVRLFTVCSIYPLT